jgi:sortase A
MPTRSAVWTERALLATGALLIAGWAAVILEARAFGFRQERRLERMARSATAGPHGVQTPKTVKRKAGARSPLAPQDLVGRIEIPRLRLRAIVAEGVSARTLRLAVGHVPGTALPGDDGNVVLAAHRDTFFRPLQDVRPGDAVAVTTPEGRFEYIVEATHVVEPTRTDLLEAAAKPTLTLVTCYPFQLIGNAPERFVVRALQVSSLTASSSSP